jgi:hypothetical protein
VIATSINMQNRIFDVISCAAVKRSTSKREIIVRLLMMVMRDVEKFRKDFIAVRYQPDDSLGRWYCFSIKFKPDESEFFSDLRKLCKCSVSLLVALAVEKYLDELMSSMVKKVINYPRFSGYRIICKIDSGTVTWKICWGTPSTNGKTRRE